MRLTKATSPPSYNIISVVVPVQHRARRLSGFGTRRFVHLRCGSIERQGSVITKSRDWIPDIVNRYQLLCWFRNAEHVDSILQPIRADISLGPLETLPISCSGVG